MSHIPDMSPLLLAGPAWAVAQRLPDTGYIIVLWGSLARHLKNGHLKGTVLYRLYPGGLLC